MSTRKQKRHEEVRQSPVAEAIAIGTAAGGLVLGTAQALAGDTEQQNSPAKTAAEPSLIDALEGKVAAPIAEAQPLPPPSDVDALSLAQQEQAPIQPLTVPAVPAGEVVAETTEVAVVPDTIPAPVQDQLVAQLSEQMTMTLAKAIGSVESGQSVPEIGQAIASDIVASAQQIVANLDIGALLAEANTLGNDIAGQVDEAAIVAEVVSATSGIADSVLMQTASLADDITSEVTSATSGIASGVVTEVAALPEAILGAGNIDDAVGRFVDLPSSILGHDGPMGSGGLLSDLFYADGASDGLAIPNLATAASTVVSDIGDVTGLLGQSYTDLSDHQGGHGLNALSLL